MCQKPLIFDFMIKQEDPIKPVASMLLIQIIRLAKKRCLDKYQDQHTFNLLKITSKSKKSYTGMRYDFFRRKVRKAKRL